MAKICSVCGAPLADNAKFCEFCGSPVPVEEAQSAAAPEPEIVTLHCEFCGAELKPGTRFCPICGRSTEKAEETPRVEPAQAYIPPQNVQSESYTAPAQPAQPTYAPPAQPQYTPPAQEVTYVPPVQPQQYTPPAQQQYAAPAQPQYATPVQPKAQKKKGKALPIILVAVAALLIIAAVIGCFVWPGWLKGGAKADDPILGEWIGAYSKFVGDSSMSDDQFSLTVKKNGKGVSHRDDFDFDMTWTLDGEDFTMQESFLGITMDYTGTLKDGVLHLYNGDPTDEWTYEYVYTRDGSMPSDTGAVTPSGDSGSKGDTPAPSQGGEEYDTGNFKVTAPEGWTVFPQTDVFSDDGELDPTRLYLSKGGESEWDLFSKPYILITYAGPRTTLWAPDKDFYDNTEDLEPLTTGSHTWTGFSGESYGTKYYFLFEDKDNVQYQLSINYDTSGGKISLDDPDVLAIMSSIETTDPEFTGSSAEPTPTPDPGTTAGTGLPDIDRVNVDPPEEIEEFDWIESEDDPGEWIEMTDTSFLEGAWKVMHIYVDDEDYIVAYDLCTIDFVSENGGLTGTYHWYKYLPEGSDVEDESDLNPTEFVGTMYESSYYGVNDEIGTLAIHNFWASDDAEYAGGTLTLEDGTEIYVYLMRP